MPEQGNVCYGGSKYRSFRQRGDFITKICSGDNSSLHLYVSTIPTEYRFHTFLEDPVYRISIATQNVAYNQPTQPGFYFGPELRGTIFRGCKIPKK